LNAATLTRAQVLRIIAESDDFALAQMNRPLFWQSILVICGATLIKVALISG